MSMSIVIFNQPIFIHFSGRTYHLLNHNCNNFSNEVAQFLCGVSIPKYILDLPNEVLNSSLSSGLLSLVSQLENSARPIGEEQSNSIKEQSPDFEQLNTQIEEARSDLEVKRVMKKWVIFDRMKCAFWIFA